jgi:hypothetical protein
MHTVVPLLSIMVVREDTNIDQSQEYVDDSEPERKRIRLQAAENKRRRKYQKQLQNYGSPTSGHVVTDPHPTGGEITSLGD